MIPVAKQDGSIRLCGDYKLTVNKAVRPEVYLDLLPRIEELFATLGRATQFTKLDLTTGTL